MTQEKAVGFKNSMTIQIGSPNWVNDLMEVTKPLGSDFWSDFTRASKTELDALEAQIGRKLPDEFVEFYRSVGYGSFPLGGDFYSPADIVASIGAPIYFVLGSLFPGAEWATREEHSNLWLTCGDVNPAPEKFTDTVLTSEGVKLYDLLQFGTDGSCCYHQLYVGPEPASFRYCLLTDGLTIENKAPSFSLGLERIIHLYQQYWGMSRWWSDG